MYKAHATSNGNSTRQRIQCIGHYDLDKTIGQGQFGKVKLATHVLTGEKVAVKIILKTRLDEETLRKVYREVRIMKLLNHPNIIKLYEVIETEKVLFLVMEYASGGEVLDFIVAHGRLSEAQARKFFQHIVSAVDYCHKRHVIHRDIKCENLLLDADLNIKIIDFGLSNCFTPGGRMQTFCGSPTYCAPELIQRHKYEGPEIDVWSLGVVLFVLVCGYLPFDAKDFQTLFRKILSGSYNVPEYVSDECSSLIGRMLEGDPEERATLQEVAAHPWLQMDAKVLDENNLGLEESEGLLVHGGNGELDMDIIEQMASLGFPPEIVRDSIANDKYDVAASTYYLLLARKLKNKGILEPLQDSRKLHSPKLDTPQPNAGPEGRQPVTRGGRGHRRHHTEGVIQNPAPPPSEPAPHGVPVAPRPVVCPAAHAPLRTSSPDAKKPAAPAVTVPPIVVVKSKPPSGATSPRLLPKSAGASPSPPPPSNSGSSSALTHFWKVQRTHKRARSVDHHDASLFESPTPAPSPEPSTSPPKRDEAASIMKHKTLSPQRARPGIPPHNASMRTTRRRPTRPKSIETGKDGVANLSYSDEKGTNNSQEDIFPTTQQQEKQPLSPRRLTPDTFVPPSHSDSAPANRTPPPEESSEKEEPGGEDTPKQARQRPHHRRAQSLGTDRVQVEKPETQNVIDEYSSKMTTPQPPKSPRQSSLNAFMASFRNAIGMMKRESKPEPRTTRFALNVSMTSSKSAEEIMAEVVRVLNKHEIQYSPSPGQQFEVVCKHKYNEEESLIFEIEICKLPMLSMNGLRLNRISGDAWVYKKVAAELIEEMEL